MTILSDLVDARRSRLRMGTNPDQFAARGEPWQMPREEALEIQARTSRKIRKAHAEKARERLPYVEPIRKTPLSERAVLARHQREMLKLALAAGTGRPSRTLRIGSATPEEHEHFLRLNTSAHISDRPFMATLERKARNTRADFDAFIRRERLANAERRAKVPHDRNTWPIV